MLFPDVFYTEFVEMTADAFPSACDQHIDDSQLKQWFFREIFPHEQALTRYLRGRWRNPADIADIRQEIYTNLYEAARKRLPDNAKAFLFTSARNHLINRNRREQLVRFHPLPETDNTHILVDSLTPDRHVLAREELKRVQAGLNRLPPKCRQVITLRKIEGLSTREVAARLNVGIDTVEQQTGHGMRALVDFMLGGNGRIQRSKARPRPFPESAAPEFG
ncbi:MAG: sigma-70 family RNA polymerase sigma factor [Asticcacaulis sp.]